MNVSPINQYVSLQSEEHNTLLAQQINKQIPECPLKEMIQKILYTEPECVAFLID